MIDGPRAADGDALGPLLRRERALLVALLARRFGLGAWAAAEDAVQAAALAALTHWPRDGWPERPTAWLYRSAQRELIDRWRRERHEQPLPEDEDDAELAQALAASDSAGTPSGRFAGELHDEELALLFAACHPALPPATQVALALRAQSELDLATIAEALLTTEAALAQRLARARDSLRGERLELPAGSQLPPRRQSVLAALQAMFNAGWAAGAGDPRRLCWEAIRLARAVAAHPATAHPDADALAATLLLHGARLTGRHDAQGEIVPLPGQPRDRWDAGMVRMGLAHLQRAQAATELSRWHLLAGIAAEHALAPDYARTAWPRIVQYYELLLRLDPSAPPRLGHAIALAEGGEPQRAEALLRELLPRVPAALAAHTHAALAHVRQQQGDVAEASACLQQAIALARHEADRRLLQRRLDGMAAVPSSELTADPDAPPS